GGMADYVEPRTRAVAHLIFWVLILLALLVKLWRERRHGWTSRARWPFLVGAIGGAVAVEALVLLFGSPTIIVGSIILLTLVLFVPMLAGGALGGDSGGFGVERGTFTVEAGGLFGLLFFLGVVPEVLLHEPLRVEILNVEVLVLRPQPLLEVLGRGVGHGT